MMMMVLTTFAFQRTMRAQEHWAAVTQDSGLHTNVPRGLPTDQFCRLQNIESFRNAFIRNSKGRQTSLMTELWLLIEWHFINRITYYISQGRVETSIRRGWQLCCSSVVNLLQYLCAKIIKIQCGLTVIAKIKECNFCASECSYPLYAEICVCLVDLPLMTYLVSNMCMIVYRVRQNKIFQPENRDIYIA